MQNIKRAKLFVCASCEWIFKHNENGCPKCGFGYYSAHYAYGDKAYRYFRTQKPWKDKKLLDYEVKLNKEILQSSEYKSKQLKILKLWQF